MFEEKQEALINSLQENNKYKIHEIIDNMYPIDIAIVLEELDDESLLKFYELIDNELMAKIVEQSNEDLQVRIIKLFDFQSIVHLFSYMSNDDIADILGNLPFKCRIDILCRYYSIVLY